MFYKLVTKILFKLPPEMAHIWILYFLKLLNKLGLLTWFLPNKNTEIDCSVTAMGINFKNPVGLAAGFDKNAQFIDELFTLGFGFIEVGTVTPRPQRGSTKPRLFRLIYSRALINRMGFNNKGLDYICQKLKSCKRHGVLGVNIGKNKDTPLSQAVDDYVCCLERVYPFVDYIVVNISSPNTKDLRKIQYGDHLTQLLDVLKSKQMLLMAQYQRYVPLVLKISPDLTTQELIYLGEQVVRYKFDGVIATNTTISRKLFIATKDCSLRSQSGGLSGAPLYKLSNNVIECLLPILSKANIPIIGVGGILSAEDAQEKFRRGAALVQLYTGLVYCGPGLIKQIIRVCAK